MSRDRLGERDVETKAARGLTHGKVSACGARNGARQTRAQAREKARALDRGRETVKGERGREPGSPLEQTAQDAAAVQIPEVANVGVHREQGRVAPRHGSYASRVALSLGQHREHALPVAARQRGEVSAQGRGAMQASGHHRSWRALHRFVDRKQIAKQKGVGPWRHPPEERGAEGAGALGAAVQLRGAGAQRL